MVQAPSRPITLDEFLTLPDTKPASEYMDGQIFQKPIPQGKHSSIQTEFSSIVNVTLKPQQVARAFSELRCTFGGRSIVPDVSVFTWDRLPRDANGAIANYFAIAPDWSVEILSPGQSQTKGTKNILHCLNYGTQMGWLIDPDEETILVFLPKQQPGIFDQATQPLPVPKFAKDLSLSVGNFFEWLTT
jgi:Uma2 family endonuclease